MEITSLQVSQDRKTLILAINDAADISSLRLWTIDTFKDYSLAVDLTSKLTGSETEVITITLVDLNIPFFDGVYFVEAEDPDELSLKVTADLTRYQECVLDQLLAATACDDCLEKATIGLINSHTLLRGLEDAVELGFMDEIISISAALDKYCSAACRTCGEYTNIINDAYYNIEDIEEASPITQPTIVFSMRSFETLYTPERARYTDSFPWVIVENPTTAHTLNDNAAWIDEQGEEDSQIALFNQLALIPGISVEVIDNSVALGDRMYANITIDFNVTGNDINIIYFNKHHELSDSRHHLDISLSNNHVTFSYYMTLGGDINGGLISSFIFFTKDKGTELTPGVPIPITTLLNE